MWTYRISVRKKSLCTDISVRENVYGPKVFIVFVSAVTNPCLEPYVLLCVGYIGVRVPLG
jgi:hypothetical protein